MVGLFRLAVGPVEPEGAVVQPPVGIGRPRRHVAVQGDALLPGPEHIFSVGQDHLHGEVRDLHGVLNGLLGLLPGHTPQVDPGAVHVGQDAVVVLKGQDLREEVDQRGDSRQGQHAQQQVQNQPYPAPPGLCRSRGGTCRFCHIYAELLSEGTEPDCPFILHNSGPDCKSFCQERRKKCLICCILPKNRDAPAAKCPGGKGLPVKGPQRKGLHRSSNHNLILTRRRVRMPRIVREAKEKGK